MQGESVDDVIRQLQALRLQEDRLLRCLVEAREREAQSAASPPNTGTAAFRIGERVRITNIVKNPFGRPATDRDRVGTVTKITKKRVFLITDSGTVTNRSPSNLQHE